MSAELAAFVDAMDRCWLEARFDDLRRFMAPGIEISVPGTERVIGIYAVIETYRDFMARCRIIHFTPSDHVATVRGSSAIVEYRWDMQWQEGTEEISAAGREIVAIDCSGSDWAIFWRTQLPA